MSSRILLLLALCLLPASFARAQIVFRSGALDYFQEFDGLANGPWTNSPVTDGPNGRLGWYAETEKAIPLALTVTTGTPTHLGRIYAFGSAKTPERALGAIPNGTSGTTYYGLRLVNNTGHPLSSVTVGYVAEQWRIGAANTEPGVLVVDYILRGPGQSTSLIEGVWFNLLDLNAATRRVNTPDGPSAGIDGNLPEHRDNRFTTIPLVWPHGHELWLRWVDKNTRGLNHGLAIDDVTISATLAR